MNWVAFFSQTGSEIVNICEEINRWPDLIVTNRMDGFDKINPELTKIYMKKRYKRSEFTSREKASYVIMTNRTLFSKKENKISNCYDEYNSENVHQISRNGMILSVIKKNNNE